MTKSGMMFSQRDIVLIPIPYTDLKSYKKRPVIIVSGDEYNNIFEDVIVVAVTSNLKPVRFSIPINNNSRVCDINMGKI
jgi:mRNA interferase MazF